MSKEIKHYKAILIQSKEQVITEIESTGRFSTLYKLLKCELIEPVMLYMGNHDGHVIYCDEEARLKKRPFYGFKINNSSCPILIGDAIIFKSDRFGRLHDCKISANELRKNIQWINF